MTKITIATRKSELALWQANHVADLLREGGRLVAVVRTSGRAAAEIIADVRSVSDRPLPMRNGRFPAFTTRSTLATW